MNSREANYRDSAKKAHKRATDKLALKKTSIEPSNNVTIRTYINESPYDVSAS